MKAAILEQLNKPLVLDEVDLPPVLECGQVRVKICYSGICGSQLGEIAGVKGEDPYLPHLLGHEGSGVVQDTGPGVTTVSPGDHVVLHWRKGSGIQSAPPQYSCRGNPVNAGFVTTFNEEAVVSENRITVIPPDFDMEQAVLFGCATLTGYGVAVNDARLKPGESVVVFGAGGVGLSVIQAASMMSAHPIIAVDVRKTQLDLAARLGATHIVDTSCSSVENHLSGILPDGADVTVDTTGIPGVIQLAYELTSSSGRTILVGVPRKDDNISIYSLPLHLGKSLAGSHGGQAQPDIDIPRLVKLCNAGLLDLTPLISDRFPLDEINSAILGMQQGSVNGRCILTINSDVS